jgi:hypothetical protein
MRIHPTRLEGVQPDGSQPHGHVPACPRLDAEVERLHWLARHGHIAPEHATRQINTYLLAAAGPPPGVPPRWLLLPLTDAPHPATLPDLGPALSRLLSRSPYPLALSAVLAQCIPSMRSASRDIGFRDSQAVCINLVAALLLGTYDPPVRQPTFATRARLYRRLHAVLTSGPAEQTAFCVRNEPAVLLACMEYLARVVPAYMPVQAALLTDDDAPTGAFFKKLPAICDEYRQQLEAQPEGLAWAGLRGQCLELVERVSRFKRCQRPRPARRAQPRLTLPGGAVAYLVAPRLLSDSADEFGLLGLALGLDGPALQAVQRCVQVHTLPSNLRDAQLARLAGAGLCRRTAYFRTHRHLCIQCVLAHRHVDALRCRLDTVSQGLVCATCLQGDLVCVDLLGRVLQVHDEHFILCPACLTVQPYRADERTWADTCTHAAPPAPRPPRPSCCVCLEAGPALALQRVDHLTGQLHTFNYCPRHAPRHETARSCANVAQLARHHALVAAQGKSRPTRRKQLPGPSK